MTLAKGSGEWNAPDKFVLRGDVRWLGSQYEDEENTLFLREAVVVGISVRRQFGDHLEFYLKADNIGDARTETSVDSHVVAGNWRERTAGTSAAGASFSAGRPDYPALAL